MSIVRVSSDKNKVLEREVTGALNYLFRYLDYYSNILAIYTLHILHTFLRESKILAARIERSTQCKIYSEIYLVLKKMFNLNGSVSK